jgi:hypothetical protein
VSVSHTPAAGTGNTDAVVDLADIAELYAVFAQVPDPRRPPGIRHHIATVLTVTVLFGAAGAANFRQAGDRVKDLPPLLLAAAGARRHRRTGQPVAPCADTLRRVAEGIDADAADLLVCR